MARYTQKQRDRQRKTYKLYFPSSLDAEQVIAWLRSISGSRSKSTLVFELWSTSEGFSYYLKVPWQAEYIIGQLQAHLPGLRYEVARAPREAWTYAVELGMSRPARSLSIYDSTATSLVGAARGLEPDEAVVMQWVVSPAPRSAPPQKASRDEIADRKAKLAEPNFAAVLRVAAKAPSTSRAKFLITALRSALRSAHSHATQFQKRFATQTMLQRRLDDPATPVAFPMQLSTRELAALIAWPVGNPLIPGLPPVMSRVLPASDAVPQAGMVLGRSTFPGHERPIAVRWEDALMHTHVLGSTGTGKSVLLAHMARQAMEAGHGVILIETEGNLYQSVLDYVPLERLDDVILMDVSDTQHPVAFNPLDQDMKAAVVDQLVDLFTHKYGNSMWAHEYLFHGLWTLTEVPGTSFTDLATLLLPRTPEEVDWQDSITRQVKDPELRRWWQRQDNRARHEQQQRTDPVLSRIWQLAARPELRHVFGQNTSTIQLREVLRDNKILLVNLKGVSKETASLAGTLLMNAAWQAIKTQRKERPTFLILDEFGDFMDLPIDTESMLAQARKHNVGMILANQNMGQLTKSVADAVVSNARNKVVFQINSGDARTLINEFGKHLEVDDLTHLQAHEAIAQVQTPSGTSTPMTLRTFAPTKRTGNANEVVFRSRTRYSRPLEDVASELANRHKRTPRGPRPAIGSLD